MSPDFGGVLLSFLPEDFGAPSGRSQTSKEGSRFSLPVIQLTFRFGASLHIQRHELRTCSGDRRITGLCCNQFVRALTHT